MKMIKYILIAIGILISIGALAQKPELGKKEQKRLQRQQKKEQQVEETTKKAAIVRQMVEHQQFVLQADRLKDKYGATVPVSSMVNFLASDSITGVIQIGDHSFIGLNGFGGLTLEGRIINYKYTYAKRSKSYNITYNLSCSTGAYDVRINVFSNGRANANVTSGWPGQLNYLGQLIPPADSKVFKGITTY